MASTAVDMGDLSLNHSRKGPQEYNQKNDTRSIDNLEAASTRIVRLDHTHRKLKSRHIQFIGIGGTVGTALYVSIGHGLLNGGPGSLFLGFAIWCTFILSVTVCMAEMVTYLPISSPFIRFAGRFVDDAFGFATGWNFFVLEAALVPFEVTACNLIIQYWSSAVPTGAIIAIILVLYACFNLMTVKWYGETEFWAALGKFLLIVGTLVFTFVAMLGGNPLHDRFGFRYWENPGSFTKLYYDGSLGRFCGFLSCFIQAAFTVAGPDYVSMAAGEAENPRVTMPKAFNAVFVRLTAFYCLGALAVGILVPYNDADLIAAYGNGARGAAASPFVIAMIRLRIQVLPDIVNAVLLTAAFSAGNSYVYCASRALYGMALEGKAPAVLRRCNKNGIPYVCVLVVLGFGLLSFLQVSSSAQVVISWLINLVTASQLINYSVMCFTYICFYRALAAQGISRDSLPYKSWGQPYLAWYGFAGCFVMTFVGGYTVFLPGQWDTTTFFFSYTMVGVCPILYVGWKLVKRTKIYKPIEVDLVKDLEEIEEYHRNFRPSHSTNKFERVLDVLFG